MSTEAQQTGLIENASPVALAVYQRMADPLAAVNQLGAAIAKSGMFGCASIDQGIVFALECLTTGIPPLTMCKRYHVIGGKLSMRADFMLAEFHRRGGKSKWIARTPDVAHIRLAVPGGESEEFRLSWEDAQKEAFPYEGKGVLKTLAAGGKPELKAQWATNRGRMQMMAARVVSDGIRAIMPEVNEGRYTPEEFDAEDWTEARSGSAAAAATVATVQPVKVEAVTTAATVETVHPVTAPASVVEPVQDAEPLASRDIIAKIEAVAAILVERGAVKSSMIPDLLARRKIESLADLTQADAEEIFAKLEAKANTLPVSDATTSEPVDSIIGEAEVLELRTLIGELNQREPKTAAAVKSWLQSQGLETLKQLRRSQYRELRAKTAVENLEAFIAASLGEIKEGIAAGN